MKIVLLITLTESLIGALLLVLWRLRQADSRIAVKRVADPTISTIDNLTARRDPGPPASARWAFIGGWKVEPQPDDRRPAFGTIAGNGSSPSAHRSIARRRHQEMYKAWSKTRHD